MELTGEIILLHLTVQSIINTNISKFMVYIYKLIKKETQVPNGPLLSLHYFTYFRVKIKEALHYSFHNHYINHIATEHQVS